MAGPLSSYCGNPGDQSDSLKLPAIRSLTDLHGPCPTPSLSAATSPPRRPLPWPLHEDTRSKAAAPSLDSSSGRFTSGTPSSSSSSSARSGQNITHLSRPLLQPPASIPAGAPASASQPHPFFDRGRKSSLYVSPPREAAMQSQDDREASAGREHSDDALSEVSHRSGDRAGRSDTGASELATDSSSHTDPQYMSHRPKKHCVWLLV